MDSQHGQSGCSLLRVHAWEGSRATIFKALLECHAIPSSDALCFICGCKTAVIRCHQCGPRVLMCSSCDAELHEKKPSFSGKF